VRNSCVSCGAEVSEVERFCHACGAPLWIECPACGAEQSAGAAFCSSCGTPLQTGARRAASVSEHEERRVVTVLFADLAGSTALGERLDPEDVRALQGDLFSLVNAAVERFGGITEKFVGDAILAVFGAPQTHEDDAERAVRAALAIRDVFPAFAARIGQQHGVEVSLRMGVNTGEVISGREAAARGELVVSGDAVNVAARLQQLADPGAILVGARTQLATHRAIVYGERRELAAKGKETPLAAWEALASERARSGRDGSHPAPLIGRENELSLLRLVSARVERERMPQLVTIFGQAGVGKSRLLIEFVEGLENARVVVGRCVPYGDGITYLPLGEVASELAGILDDDRVEIALAKLRDSIERTVSAELVDRVVDAVAWTMGLALPGRAAGVAIEADVRRTLHDAWTRYLVALGREALLVLVIEDLHWASDPLLDLLEDVAGALENTRVLILCPSRPELLDARPSWGTGSLMASSLTLSPLSAQESEGLLRALLDTETVPEHVARAILEPAEGNPFFVEEMLSMLVEQGALEERGGGWAGTDRLETMHVPDSIHGVIAARIDLLDAFDREALRRCSVMGRVFWPSAVGVEDDVIAGLGRRAIVSEQVESSFSGRREFAFKHALTHEVAYATLPRVERRDLHRRVAEWISESVPDRQAETTEVIAYHYEQALRHGERDDELERRLFMALLAAGEAAGRRGAYESADAMLGRALDVAPSEVERSYALLVAAQVDIATTRYERAIERLNETISVAERIRDPTLRADALGWKARASWLSASWRDAIESSQDAVATLEGLAESAELARALARLSQIQMLRALPEAAGTATRAIEVARRTGALTAEANARTNLFTARSASGVMPSTGELEEIIELALAAGAHAEAARAVVNYLWSAALLGPLEPVERLVKDAVSRLGLGFAAEGYEQYVHVSLAALVYVPVGRWREADDVVGLVETARSGSVRLVWLWLVAGLALRRGDLDVTDTHLPELRDTALASEEPQRILPMASIAMSRALLADDSDAASELADIVLGLRIQTLTLSAAMIPICRVLAATEDQRRLEKLVDIFRVRAGSGQPGTMLKVARGLLELLQGRADSAGRLFLEAEAELHSYGRHYDAACVALEVERALETSGDASGAGAARARARELLDAIGCVNPY
jgi:class 3 adenylate cyclase/tetratricopeptide (TPR) repeat protein